MLLQSSTENSIRRDIATLLFFLGFPKPVSPARHQAQHDGRIPLRRQ